LTVLVENALKHVTMNVSTIKTTF